MTLVLIIAVIILLISLNALYVAAEFSTVSARRARVQRLADAGNEDAQEVLSFLEDPKRLDRYIATCQIGITLSSLTVGFYGQSQLGPYLGFGLSSAVSAVLILVLLTVLQVIFGELIPKSLATRYPERYAIMTARPVVASLVVLRPLIALFNGSAVVLLRLFGVELTKEAHAHSPEELEFIFSESAQGGYLDAEEKEMLENVLNFDERLARQIMVPRNRMTSVALGSNPAELLPTLVDTPHTRFPVYNATIDKVVGAVNLKDVYLLAQQNPAGSLSDIVREVPLLPETNTVTEVWDALQEQQSPLAVLFDEYGGTVGMMTIEDIIEEIIGEVEDEFDSEDALIEQRGNTLYLRADVQVSALNRKFLLSLPENRADTVGGLLFEVLGRPPRPGDSVHLSDLTLRAEEVSAGAVQRLKLELPGSKPASGSGASAEQPSAVPETP